MERMLQTSLLVLVIGSAFLLSTTVLGEETWQKKLWRKGEKHDIYWGTNTDPKTELYRKRVKKSPIFWPVAGAKFYFPAEGKVNTIIKLIKANDLILPAGNGGYGRVVKGGIGYKFVTLEFKSQWFCSLDFEVIVYGF